MIDNNAITIKNNRFIDKAGYFKITLANEENVLMTKEEYDNLQNGKEINIESTSGTYYKSKDGQIYFTIK